tara:strand:- start:648 stop:992 length:345 start_codon:yes stop_codon:yes gene_type:complete
MRKFIYKICTSSEWSNFKKNEKFFGSKQDLVDGYIHLSNKNQIQATLKKHYYNKSKLILLKVKTASLKNLIWEKSTEGKLFPHLYSYIKLKDIKKNFKISLKKNGLHYLSDFER